jgi:flagellar motility protein MotE (MotC chaperone)
MRLPRLRLLPLLIGGLALLLGVKLGSAGMTLVAAWPQGGVGLVASAQAQADSAPRPAAAPAQTAAPAPANAAGPVASPPRPAATQRVPQGPAPAPEASEIPTMAAAERSLLEQLRTRRVEIDRREQAAAEREVLIAAAERRLAERIESLAALQARLEAAEQARSAREEAGWRQMVKLYEGMRPRDAAAIFDDLEMPVLVQILARMGERKAAPVLGAMRPDRARLVTAELARHRAAAPTN